MMQQSQSESKLAVPVSKVSFLKAPEKGVKHIESDKTTWSVGRNSTLR